MVLLITMVSLWGCTSSLGQSAYNTDSLYRILPTLHDTLRVNALIRIGRGEIRSSPEQGIHSLRKAINLAKEIGYTNGLANAYSITGAYFVQYFNNFDTARLFLDSALAVPVPDVSKRELLYLSSMWHSMKGEFNVSHDILAEALRINGNREDATTALILQVMGYNLTETGRKREALRYYNNAIHIHKKLNKIRNLAAALNNTALVYMDMGEYDSAQMLFEHLYKIELEYGNPLDNATMLQNMGKLHLKKNQPDSAYYFFHVGLAAAKRSNQPTVMAMGLIGLGLYHLTHNLDSTLYYGHKALTSVGGKQYLLMEEVNKLLSQAHAKAKRFDSAYYYQSHHLAYHDSVFQEKTTRQIAELEIEFDVERKALEIEQLRQAQTQEAWQRKALLAMLILTIMAALFMFLFLRARIRARKKELDMKNHQLMQYARTMLEKTELAEQLKQQLVSVKTTATMPDLKTEHVSQILQSVILTDDDWEEFKALFEQVHYGFFADLRIKFPDLTLAETRLAALLKMGLTTREIANMLAISTESANKARYRLRKKLEIPHEQDLKAFIEQAVDEKKPE